MSLLSPRLQLKVAQKQILTPGLVQMVTVLQLNRLELKEMINQEIVNNPVLEEAAETGEDVTPEELQPLLEAEAVHEPSDRSILEASGVADNEIERLSPEIELNGNGVAANAEAMARVETSAEMAAPLADAETVNETPSADPFDEIDFG